MRQVSAILALIVLLLPAAFISTLARADASQSLPANCGPVGVSAYQPPFPPPPFYKPPASHGTVITVTSSSDDHDGNISSAQSLLANQGPDGTISLREAMLATVNSPGTYTIRFAPSLKGSTIYIAQQLPLLLGGNVLIDGNVGNGTTPDITIAPASGSYVNQPPPLAISSSGNVLYALALVGFGYNTAVGFQELASNKLYSDNTIANLDITVPALLNSQTNGIALYVGTTHVNDVLDHTYIINNTVQVQGGGIDSPGEAIRVGFAADNNTVQNLVIAYNKIRGSFVDTAIEVDGSLGGPSFDKVENVTILGNHIDIPTPRVPQNWSAGGIFVNAGGGTQWQNQNPPTFSTDSSVKNVWILNNTISHHAGYGIKISAGSSGSKRIAFDSINILGNSVTSWADTILVGDDGDNNYTSVSDRLSNLAIKDNTLVFNATISPQYVPDPFGGAGIFIRGGQAAMGDKLQNFSISHNIINTSLVSINIVGGWGYSTVAAINNTVSSVNVSCNDVVRSPTYSQTCYNLCQGFPWIKGIDLVGGYHNSKGNAVNQVQLTDNTVAGVPNDVSGMANLEQGATGNVINYTTNTPTTSTSTTTTTTISTTSTPTTATTTSASSTSAATTSSASLTTTTTAPSSTSTITSGPSSSATTTTAGSSSSFATSSVSSSPQILTSSSTTTSTGSGGIPEFPYQLVVTTVFASLLVASYLLARRNGPLPRPASHEN